MFVCRKIDVIRYNIIYTCQILPNDPILIRHTNHIEFRIRANYICIFQRSLHTLCELLKWNRLIPCFLRFFAKISPCFTIQVFHLLLKFFIKFQPVTFVFNTIRTKITIRQLMFQTYRNVFLCKCRLNLFSTCSFI